MYVFCVLLSILSSVLGGQVIAVNGRVESCVTTALSGQRVCTTTYNTFGYVNSGDNLILQMYASENYTQIIGNITIYVGYTNYYTTLTEQVSVTDMTPDFAYHKSCKDASIYIFPLPSRYDEATNWVYASSSDLDYYGSADDFATKIARKNLPIYDVNRLVVGGIFGGFRESSSWRNTEREKSISRGFCAVKSIQSTSRCILSPDLTAYYVGVCYTPAFTVMRVFKPDSIFIDNTSVGFEVCYNNTCSTGSAKVTNGSIDVGGFQFTVLSNPVLSVSNIASCLGLANNTWYGLGTCPVYDATPNNGIYTMMFKEYAYAVGQLGSRLSYQDWAAGMGKMYFNPSPSSTSGEPHSIDCANDECAVSFFEPSIRSKLRSAADPSICGKINTDVFRLSCDRSNYFRTVNGYWVAEIGRLKYVSYVASGYTFNIRSVRSIRYTEEIVVDNVEVINVVVGGYYLNVAGGNITFSARTSSATVNCRVYYTDLELYPQVLVITPSFKQYVLRFYSATVNVSTIFSLDCGQSRTTVNATGTLLSVTYLDKFKQELLFDTSGYLGSSESVNLGGLGGALESLSALDWLTDNWVLILVIVLGVIVVIILLVLICKLKK